MPSRVANAREWFESVCRQFADATGWPLEFTAADDRPADLLRERLRDDEECCWHAEIHDGNDTAGFLHVHLPPDSRHDRSFLAVCELADVIAQLLNNLVHTARQLDSRTQDVSTLVDIGRSLPGEDDLLGAIRQLLRACVQLTEFRSVAFFLLDSTTSELRLRTSHHIEEAAVPGARRSLMFSPPDLEALVKGSVVVRRDEFEGADRWLPLGCSTGLCLAVQSPSGPLGTLWAFDRRTRAPDDREIHVLESIASQISAVLERVVLRHESDRQVRLRRELQLVSELHPEEVQFPLPPNPRYEYAARCLSRHELGGDLCELIALDEHRTSVAVGDACGDSLPAAMVMTAARGALRALTAGPAPSSPEPADVISRINLALYAITHPHQFMSFLYGILDVHAMSFTYCNAGHPIPILMRQGEIDPLRSHGMLLGVTDDAGYDQSVVELKPGDLLVLYSDGIIEAMNRRKQMFRSDGIVSAIRAAAGGSAREVLEAIWGKFESHTADGDDPDDRTLLVIRLRDPATPQK